MFRFLAIAIAFSFLSFSACAEEIPTRFCSLKINDENMLLFNNKPLDPAIQGNSGLSVEGSYQIGNTDVVLVADIGGSACPVLLYFVTTSSSGVTASPEFGTCSDLIEVTKKADSIAVTMPGFRSSAVHSEAEQRKAFKEKHTYVFTGGVLTENGRPVK